MENKKQNTKGGSNHQRGLTHGNKNQNQKNQTSGKKSDVEFGKDKIGKSTATTTNKRNNVKQVGQQGQRNKGSSSAGRT